jgi:hypothetical protein
VRDTVQERFFIVKSATKVSKETKAPISSILIRKYLVMQSVSVISVIGILSLLGV